MYKIFKKIKVISSRIEDNKKFQKYHYAINIEISDFDFH